MKIRLNLATKPLETHRRFLAGSSFLSVIAIAAFLGLGWHVYLARKANEEMRIKTGKIADQVKELDAQREALEHFFNIEENRKLGDRADFINKLIDARSFNWTLMFMDLEKILPAGVRVVSIEPTQNKGRVEVKLIMGASSDDAQLKVMKALEDSKFFTDIQLVNSRRPQPGPNVDPILMELTAEYART